MTADVLRRSGRLDEALAACKRALALREPLVEAHPELPLYRATPRRDVPATRAGAMRHERPGRRRRRLETGVRALRRDQAPRSRADVSLGLLPRWPGGPGGPTGLGESAAEGADQSEKAMAVLRQAVAMGYRNLNAYRTESALDPLRDRPDFRLLMMDLAFPAEPFAEYGDSGFLAEPTV